MLGVNYVAQALPSRPSLDSKFVVHAAPAFQETFLLRQKPVERMASHGRNSFCRYETLDRRAWRFSWLRIVNPSASTWVVPRVWSA